MKKASLYQSKLPTVTRFEVIDENGRVVVYNSCSVDLSFQDEMRTLKVFVKKESVKSE